MPAEQHHEIDRARPIARIRGVKSRIMYVEHKSSLAGGEARIGRVSFSRTGCTLYYGGKTFQSLKGGGFKSNYVDTATGEQYWITGPRKDGADRLYGERVPVAIDADIAEEYWTTIRNRVWEPEALAAQ